MNILIVDNDQMSCKLVGFVLQEEGFEVTFAQSIRGARAILERTTPALIILEADLPDGDGLAFCKQLSQEAPSLPVILLTTRDRLIDRLTGLKCGAADYVVKPCEYSELVERVKAVLRRSSRLQKPLMQTELQVGDLELSTTELKVRLGNQPPIALTHTEMKILKCLMLNVGLVLSREQLGELALGYDTKNASNIVDVYMLRLRRKLQDSSSKVKYLETVTGSGYRMVKPGKTSAEAAPSQLLASKAP